jgi:hypothetical protein
MRGSEEAEFFVVADGGGVEAGAVGKFTDFHGAPFEDWGANPSRIGSADQFAALRMTST